MLISTSNWHNRFKQQAKWTEEIRKYLYNQVALEDHHRILDVGCGTGVITNDFCGNKQGIVYGLDLSFSHLKYARSLVSKGSYTLADAHNIPYPDETFKLTLCHFLLLWVKNPLQVVREMVRVTQKNGVVMALAEPDYGGRIDYPPEMELFGERQTVSLQHQGADPLMGRKLASIFNQVGLSGVEIGVLGGQWRGPPSQEEMKSEWQILAYDINTIISNQDAERFREIDSKAWKKGERVLFVPTFYAWGKKC